MIRMTILVTSTIAFLFASTFAHADTGFTYQGELKENGQVANGSFNMEFALWDALSAGNQIGATIVVNGVPVTDGKFTVELDFGATAFDNSDRWLEIVVNSTTLSPRQPITRAPYSIQTRGIIVDANENVGMGVSPGSARLRVWNFAGNGLETVSNSRAVEAITTDGDMAILASNQSANGMGVFAQHTPSQNQGWLGTPDYGVYGRANDTTNDWAGYFLGNGYFSGNLSIGTVSPTETFDVDGTILARNRLLAGFPNAFFWADPAQGFVGVGRNSQVTGAEVFGISKNTSSFGGMYAETSSQLGEPFYGYSAGGDVDAYHYFDGDDDIWKFFLGSAHAMFVRTDGRVTFGTTPDNSVARVSIIDDSIALNVDSDSVGMLVTGRSTSTTAQFFNFGGGLTARFNGNVQITGNLSKGSGSFKIDHPLDPEHKYLSHSFVESPDMMNIYNGNIITDDEGIARVELPAYFDALNRDFRYQLTVIGTFAQAIVGEKIRDNRFVIRTNQPNIEVSWQVTGIRDDPYAQHNRIVVEEVKPHTDRGSYLHPKAYGKPEAIHLDRKAGGEIFGGMSANQSTSAR